MFKASKFSSGNKFLELSDFTSPNAYITAKVSAALASVAQTLTNTRLARRVDSATTVATYTLNVDTFDAVKLTAQASALTLANPTGTPTAMQTIQFRIKDNGTARAITFGANFRALGVTLPTTTVVNKTVYITAHWNVDAAKWDVTGVQQEA